MNFSIIVQARSTSTRFSNKIMAEIDGKPIILHVINACMQAGYEPIFCIPKNDNVKQWLISKGLIFHEGSEHNVLERYYQTACKFEIKNIMRITCDCPLINSETINYLAWHHLKFGSSFTSNCINKSIDGQDIDIMTFKCLELAYKNATQEYDKEHVTTYIKRCIRDNEFPGFPDFLYTSYENNFLKEWFPKMSVDTVEDLERIKEIYFKIKKNEDYNEK